MTVNLNIAGLFLDLVGVLMLGYDILVIQSRSRRTALENQRILGEAYAAGYLGLTRTQIEAGDVSEGLFEGHGYPDLRALEGVLSDFKREIESGQEGLTNTIDYLIQSIEIQAKSSTQSLRLTYWGLALIVSGFGLQIAAAMFVGKGLV